MPAAQAGCSSAPRAATRTSFSRTLLLLLLMPAVHPALLTVPTPCRLSMRMRRGGVGSTSGIRRARRTVRACADPADDEVAEADADLASAWLDDEKASSIDDSGVAEIAPAAAQELVGAGEIALLDLRTPWQFAREFVPGAVNVPAGEPGPSGLLFHFREDFVDALRESHPPGKLARQAGPCSAPLLLLCEFGVISLVAAQRLLEQGWVDVRVVRGGFEAWQQETDSTVLDERLAEEEMPFPVWTAAEGEELGLWPVAQADPPVEDDEADGLADEAFDFGELDLGAELNEEEEAQLGELEALFGEAAPAGPPPPPTPEAQLAQAALAAEGLGELMADLDKPLADGAQGAKRGRKRSTAPPVPLSAALADAATPPPLDAPPQPAAPPLPLQSAAATYGGPTRTPRSSKGRTRNGLPPAWLVDVRHIDFAASAARGELASLSVKELKSYLYERDGSLSGAKKVLVERVVEKLQEEAEAPARAPTGASPAAPFAASPAAPFAAAPAAPEPPPAAPQPVNGAAAPLGAMGTPPPLNGAATPPLGGELGGDEGDEDIPVPSLFDSDGGDPQDDFLIDEVFSAM